MGLLCERSQGAIAVLHTWPPLIACAVYADIETDGQHDKELHYREACGTPLCVYLPHEAPGSRTWANWAAGPLRGYHGAHARYHSCWLPRCDRAGLENVSGLNLT